MKHYKPRGIKVPLGAHFEWKKVEYIRSYQPRILREKLVPILVWDRFYAAVVHYSSPVLLHSLNSTSPYMSYMDIIRTCIKQNEKVSNNKLAQLQISWRPNLTRSVARTMP
jgi:hypothetical protein